MQSRLCIKGFGGLTSKPNYELTKDKLVKDRGATKETLILEGFVTGGLRWFASKSEVGLTRKSSSRPSSP